MWPDIGKSPRMAETPDTLGFVPPLYVWHSQSQAPQVGSSYKINRSNPLHPLGSLQSTNMLKHLSSFNVHNYSAN